MDKFIKIEKLGTRKNLYLFTILNYNKYQNKSDPNGEWIQVWRKFRDNPLYKDSPSFHLMLHMVIKATPKEIEGYPINGKQIDLKRGQFVSSQRELSAETGISTNTVSRKLDMLQGVSVLSQLNIEAGVTLIDKDNIDMYKDKNKKDGDSSRLNIKAPKKPKSDISIIIDHFFNKHLEKFGRKYHVQGAKDGNIAKNLLLTYKCEELKQVIDLFFEMKSPFLNKAGYTIGVFKSQVGSIVCNMKKKPTANSEPVIDDLANDLAEARKNGKL